MQTWDVKIARRRAASPAGAPVRRRGPHDRDQPAGRRGAAGSPGARAGLDRVVDGEVEIEDAERRAPCEAAPGSLALTAPNERHEVRAVSGLAPRAGARPLARRGTSLADGERLGLAALCVRASSTTSTATCRRSRRCSPTRARPAPSGSCSAATTRCSARCRRRRSRGCRSSTRVDPRQHRPLARGPRRRTRTTRSIAAACEYCRERARATRSRASSLRCARRLPNSTERSSATPRRAPTWRRSCPTPPPASEELLAGAGDADDRVRPQPPPVHPRDRRRALLVNPGSVGHAVRRRPRAPPTRSGTAAARSSCDASSTTATATWTRCASGSDVARRRGRDLAHGRAGRFVTGGGRDGRGALTPTSRSTQAAGELDARRRHAGPAPRLRRDADHRRGHLGRAARPRRGAAASCAGRSSSTST